MKKDRQGGYVGLIAILIVVAMIAFIMLKEYESLELAPLTGGYANTTVSTTSVSVTASPIQQAKDVKALIETQDRSQLQQ